MLVEDNMASDSLVSQYPNGSELANKATDGYKISCSRTQGHNVKLQVDLKKESIVTGIYITLGEFTTKNGMHSVYASNTSTCANGIVLYNEKDLPTEIHFYEVFRYLTYLPKIQGSSFDLEVCEIGIIGCHPTHYGPVCDQRCPENCHGPCDLETGLCIFGCLNGWTGVECKQACQSGTYGKGCQACSTNCFNPSCNRLNGECIGECNDGWKGLDCTKKCPNSQFGRNCSGFCEGCISKLCDHVDGLCDDKTVCKPGYVIGEYCNKTCEEWYFGNNCSMKCNCLDLPCNKFDGLCPPEGCKEGWHGKSCDQECNRGFFGRNCETYCKGCVLNICDSMNGLCYNNTDCESGFIFENYCNNTCDDWYFGNNCTRECNCLTGPCNPLTGKCPPGGCEKEWHGESCDKVGSESLKEEPTNAAAISGTVAAIIIVVLILVASLIVYKRRSVSTKGIFIHWTKSNDKIILDTKKNVSSGKGYANVHVATVADRAEITLSTIEREDTKLQLSANEDRNVYNNVPSEHNVFKYKILTRDLKEAINEKQKNDGFNKEYEVLPKGLAYAHVEGSKAENKEKNRFLTTWPYDHSRVVLKGDTKHGYINASYIDNYEKEKAYIASQGPKKKTLRDFWHMVWQDNVGKIVMVTQLIENKKIKCDRYWPETVNEPMVVNNYIVTMKEEREHTVYVYRLLTVSNKTLLREQEREIHHFHFTEWPDHGVPDSIKVVNFYRKVKSKTCCQHGPMVVHCSAGIGRTGTFIAIDALYENGKKVGHINVMECINMMRKDRMNMVQTYEQYEAIFEALLELFTVPDTSIPKKEFCQYISDQEQKKLPQNQKLYKLEYQRLETLRPVYPPSVFSDATSKDNISKNSTKKIFPHNRYRPYTMSHSGTRNDYINAVIIPEYTYGSKILVTQCPLEETVVDFWTMVFDHNSHIVVLLDQLNKNAPLCLGRQEVLEFQDLTIVQDNSPNPEELKLTLSHKEKEPMTITVFTTSKVDNDAMLSSNILLDLLKKVIKCWKKQKGPITVVCSDGCSKSGVFVALKLILEKMEIDDEIDVFQVVRTMQVRRPEFFTEFDQYEYCYRFIKEYLENDSVYANL
ncbi:receptor-type tyrosine-protein phosphatase epsilon-like [Mytilus edulis]|uniref:receptor-type tyrosine-protein phosphatase epsilon-like n=1 Tax=Mytilus edulis TaxID=6550 RepID=UPI0039F02BEE